MGRIESVTKIDAVVPTGGLMMIAPTADNGTVVPHINMGPMEEVGGGLLTTTGADFTRMMGKSLSAKELAKVYGEKVGA